MWGAVDIGDHYLARHDLADPAWSWKEYPALRCNSGRVGSEWNLSARSNTLNTFGSAMALPSAAQAGTGASHEAGLCRLLGS
jgi:hypothetical protein